MDEVDEGRKRGQILQRGQIVTSQRVDDLQSVSNK
jgi:hypothetical protein